MDSFGQVGPEKGDYELDVEDLARSFDFGALFCKLAHRMTQYRLIIVPAERLLFLPDPSTIGREEDWPHWAYVGVEGHGAGWLGGWIAPDYVREVLGLAGRVDGEIVGEFLTRLGVVRAALRSAPA